MNKIIFVILIIFAGINSCLSQSYIDAGGIRIGGGEFGVTYKRLLENKWTIEGIATQSFKDRNKDLTVAILGEKHFPVLSRRLNIYFGGGIQAQFLGVKTDPTVSNGAGIAGIAGLEFTIDRLNISYDIKPAVYLLGGRSDFDSQVALSLRYVFTKRTFTVDWNKLKFWDGWFKKKEK